MKKFLIYGDSVSCEFNQDPELTWTRRLQTAFLDDHRDIEIVNHSRRGETTRLALERLPSILTERFDYAFVELGGNDYLSGRSCIEIHRDLTDICQVLKEQGTKVLLQEVLVGLIKRNPKDQEFNEIYHRISRELDIFIIPLPAIETRDHLDLAISLFEEDGIHFNRRSQPMICDWVYGSIKDQL